ncbi:MAG: Crp/Fnr family transcriptional regulator [Bacteroidota bacterium]
MNTPFFAELKEIPDFKLLAPEIIKEIANRAKKVNYKRGDIIIRDGELANWIGVITKGLVRGFSKVDNGTEKVWVLFKEHDYCVSPHSFYQELPARGHLQALENLELLTISKKDHEDLSIRYPTFKTHTFRILSQRMMYHVTEKNRLINMDASGRYQYFIATYPDLIARVSLGNISSLLGIRQSSLSRIRRNLSRKKFEE